MVGFSRGGVAPRVVRLGQPMPLVRWCRERGVRDALVGGFFLRPGHQPLGELRLEGRPIPSEAFPAPWSGLRGCLHVVDQRVRLAPRRDLGEDPAGDLLQAGPLLLSAGRSMISGEDTEGFSAGSHQFDSDITAGRYPRTALALTEDQILAVACDGRHDADAGMTLAELADTLAGLGVQEALNLDGGGSSSLIQAGRLRNRPRAEHGVDLLEGRSVVTAIVFPPRS